MPVLLIVGIDCLQLRCDEQHSELQRRSEGVPELLDE